MSQYYTNKVTRPIRYCENVRSDTDSGAGIWCPRAGKYVKPSNSPNGITIDKAQYPPAKPKVAVEPIGLGDIDS